jgi:hypothetical protein
MVIYLQIWSQGTSRYIPFNCDVDILHYIILNILCHCSAADKAHLRLAAAKAVLRLSKQWDHKVPVDVFYLTLRISQVFLWEMLLASFLLSCSVFLTLL